MLVVADSSPVNVLIRIGHIDVLPTLFERVVIPGEVAKELSHAKTPQVVKEFIARPPRWFDIREPKHFEALHGIDPGEQAAICLAKELNADLLLIDDWDARQAALNCSIRIIGTVGVLERAAGRGLLDMREAFGRLREIDFRISDTLLEQALRRAANRNRQK
jgi:predicted nucleic acid-binding protein